MKIVKLILTFLFGAFLVFGGINHFTKPEMYHPFLPEFLPRIAISYLIGIVEIALGLGCFIPQFRPMATKGCLILMLVFLPFHIVDVFREHPAVGTHQIALIRLPMQFVLIAWAWFIQKTTTNT